MLVFILAFRAKPNNFYVLGFYFKVSSLSGLLNSDIELVSAALSRRDTFSADEKKVAVIAAGERAANIGIECCNTVN